MREIPERGGAGQDRQRGGEGDQETHKGPERQAGEGRKGPAAPTGQLGAGGIPGPGTYLGGQVCPLGGLGVVQGDRLDTAQGDVLGDLHAQPPQPRHQDAGILQPLHGLVAQHVPVGRVQSGRARCRVPQPACAHSSRSQGPWAHSPRVTHHPAPRPSASVSQTGKQPLFWGSFDGVRGGQTGPQAPAGAPACAPRWYLQLPGVQALVNVGVAAILSHAL